jgi:serine/threonine protein kinase
MSNLVVGSKIDKCMNLFIIYFCGFVDLVNKILTHGASGFTFVVLDPDLHDEFVLKLIPFGPEESLSRTNNKKTIEKEIKVGLIVAKESKFLVQYSEIFQWEDFFCIKMEYCRQGDLQNQLDNEKFFTEEVFVNSYIFFYFFIRKLCV